MPASHRNPGPSDLRTNNQEKKRGRPGKPSICKKCYEKFPSGKLLGLHTTNNCTKNSQKMKPNKMEQSKKLGTKPLKERDSGFSPCGFVRANDPTDEDSSSIERGLGNDDPMIVSIRGDTSFIRQSITRQEQVNVKNENQEDDKQTNDNQPREHTSEIINNVPRNSISSPQAEPSSSQPVRRKQLLPSAPETPDDGNNNCRAPCGERNCRENEERIKVDITMEMSAAAFARVAPFIFGAVNLNDPPQIVVNQKDEEEQDGTVVNQN